MEGGLINDLNIREQSSFWQFSDQLRLQTNTFSGLSLGDSIWSDGEPTSYSSKPAVEDRRNVDVANPDWKSSFLPHKLAFGNSNNLDRYNTLNTIETGYSKNSTGIANRNNNNNNNNDFNYNYNNNNFNGEMKSNYFSKAVTKPIGNSNGLLVNSKKNHSNNEGNGKKKNGNSNNYSNGNNNSSAVDKRFKTLPPSEALPRNEAIGGYIFVCNNDTMEENLRRQLFGLPSRYRDSVRAIRPGLPLFSLQLLHTPTPWRF